MAWCPVEMYNYDCCSFAIRVSSRLSTVCSCSCWGEVELGLRRSKCVGRRTCQWDVKCLQSPFLKTSPKSRNVGAGKQLSSQVRAFFLNRGNTTCCSKNELKKLFFSLKNFKSFCPHRMWEMDPLVPYKAIN